MTQNRSKYDVYIGIDVAKSSSDISIRAKDKVSQYKKIPGTPKALTNYIKKRHGGEKVICAYEAGPTGFGLYDNMTKAGIECLVVSPSSIPKAKSEKVKNNRIDSRKLVEYLEMGKLSSIRVPEGIYRQLRHMVKVRENYAIMRKLTKQRIKGLLLLESLHSRIKASDIGWTRRYLDELRGLKTDEAVRYRLNMLMNDLDYARTQVLGATRKLREFCKTNEDIHRNIGYLTSIPGVGFVVASTILGRIGDPGKLRDIRELSSFMGMVPWERSTGETENRGNITHLGDTILRKMLIESAWVAIRKDIQLRQFYYRIKSRHHPRFGAKKAIVAVARKMTHIVYRVLKDQRNYE